MRKILFASDLDNTLLFSYKYKKEHDICVEVLDGKLQGYMTPLTLEMLGKINQQCFFVPVTSRSIQQYQRIKLPEACIPQYALTTNGAVLFNHGEIDQEWIDDSVKLIEPWKEELLRTAELLRSIPNGGRCRIVDEMYLFTACDTAEQANELKCLMGDKTVLQIQTTGRKVYFFPPALTKGNSVKRLQKKLNVDMVIAAGDSEIDRSMLIASDVAILPEPLLRKEDRYQKKYIWERNERFSEFILQRLFDELQLKECNYGDDK